MAANSSLRALYRPGLRRLPRRPDRLARRRLRAVRSPPSMSLLVVVRHTRDEEESGRQELRRRPAMVGRRAPLTAALLAAVGRQRRRWRCWSRRGLAGSGRRRARSRSASGIARRRHGLRHDGGDRRPAHGERAAGHGADRRRCWARPSSCAAAGDAGDRPTARPSLTWLSPLGWLENLRAVRRRTLVGAARCSRRRSLAQGAVAYELAGRRDVGHELPADPPRTGGRPARHGGRAGLAAAAGQRAAAGRIGFLAAGVVFGGMADGAADLVGDNEQAREIFERMGGQSGHHGRLPGLDGRHARHGRRAVRRRARCCGCTARRRRSAPNRSWRTRWAACAGPPATW